MPYAALSETHLLRLLIDEVPAAIAMFDRDMRYIAASKRWIEAYLPGVSQPAGRCHYDLFPDCPERWRIDHRRGLAGEDVQVEEDSWPLPDGTLAWMRYEVRPWRTAEGEVGGILILTEDITDRKRAEADLERTHARLDAALRAPQVAVFHHDQDLRYTWIHNPAHGISPGQITGLRDSDLLERPEEAMRIESIKRSVLESGVPAREEVTLHFNGEPSWYDLIVEPAISNGQTTGVYCVAIDITERHVAQSALLASEERLSVAKAAAGLGIHDYDVQTGRVNWDKRIRELWGVSDEEEITYGTFLSGLHPDDIAATDAAVTRALDPSGDGLYCGEYRVINRLDGMTRWIAATGKASFVGQKPVRLVGTVQDITQRKEEELERERSRALLNAVLDSMPAGVMIADASGRIVRSNKANEVLWGINLGDGELTDVVTATHPWRGRRYPSGEPMQPDAWPLARALARRETVRGEVIEIEPFDGQPPRVIVKMAAPALADDGRLIAAVAVQTDITDRVRIEEALKRADRQKDVFLATLSHELRNPLAPIRTAAELLANPKLEATQLAWAQGVIQRQVKHLAVLLDDLLDLARITQGKLELRRQVVAVRSVVDTALEATRPLLDRKSHGLKVDLPSQPVLLDVDPVRVAQVITNLLTNAAKYTDAGGAIELRVREEDDSVLIEVADSGAGISKEALPRVFEMFSQGDASLEQSEGGLGIGLALVKGIAELHGGSVVAQSEGTGRGSTFTLTLPRAVGQRPPGPNSEAHSVAGGCRVLVVDDNRDGADALAMTLQLSGHTVRVAYDGASALATAQAFRPEVGILDIGMPGMDGFELASRLRAEPWAGTLALIALTGWGQQHDRDRAERAGFDQHITKPVDPAVLLKAISGYQHTASYVAVAQPELQTGAAFGSGAQ